MKAFYGELALATENAFQTLCLLLTCPAVPARGLPGFLGEREGMPTAAGDTASLELNLKVSEAARSPRASPSGLSRQHRVVWKCLRSPSPGTGAGMVPQLLDWQDYQKGGRELGCKAPTTHHQSQGRQLLGIVFPGPGRAGAGDGAGEPATQLSTTQLHWVVAVFCGFPVGFPPPLPAPRCLPPSRGER